MTDEMTSLLKQMIQNQELTNKLLENILNELRHSSSKPAGRDNFDENIESRLFDPEFLLKFNKRTQDVILFIAKHFSKNNNTLIVEQVQDSLKLSYPQSASYLNDLEQKGILKSRRGKKDIGEEPLKKYYFIPN